MAVILSKNPTISVVIAALGLLLSLALLVMRKRKVLKANFHGRGPRLPPGPPGKPIIGNAQDTPKHHGWETYIQWAKKYGNLVYINIFGQSIVIVNSVDIARDLFETRSSLYSDRSQFTMLNELCGFDKFLGLMPYGDRWREYRRTFHQHFRPKAVVAYRDIEVKHTREMLQRLCKWPDDFVMHMRHMSGAIIIEVTYGIKVYPLSDPNIQLAERVAAVVTEAGNPGSFLVDTLPILKYVPEWIPGAGFKKKARAWRALNEETATTPFMAVKQAFDAGTAGPSFVASLLEELSSNLHPPPDREEVICYTAAQAYSAAVETTTSELDNLVLAMVLYPEVQRKAQAELDFVVGPGRLPTFDDRPQLHYINALCKEIHRWQPVVPLGNPHRLMKDDVYGDYFIPGGSLVVGNIWAMLRDENTYGPQPEKFIPERFLEPGVPNPTVAFGFGRRICPGRHMADDIIFIAVASILQVFDISNAKDKHGNEIPLKSSVTSGFMVHPEPFKCQIKPRSKLAEALICNDPSG